MMEPLNCAFPLRSTLHTVDESRQGHLSSSRHQEVLVFSEARMTGA
jgi:hypothetical protein